MIPYVKDWLPVRLRELYELASSSDWELVGKTVGRRDERSGTRFGSFVEGETRRVRGGWPDLAPELSDGPKKTAAAIRRGKGKVFERIKKQVARYAVREGWARWSRAKRPSVPAHRSLTKKCLVCGVPHTKKQHKFHGQHSFHTSHAWGFSMNKKKNPSASMPLIYGKVLRVEAQKTQRHVCDSECKHVGHRYYHDFSTGPDMLGLPAGSRLVLPDGKAYKLSERSLLITKSLRGSR